MMAVMRRSSRLAKNDTGVPSAVVAKIEEVVVPKREKRVKDEPKLVSRRTKKDDSTPPDQWEEVYRGIESYREIHSAAVDTMGCERLAESGIPERQARFQTLVSLMLSSQTKDTVTSATVRILQAQMPGGLCLESMLKIDEQALDNYIKAVGFHNKKAVYLKKTAQILQDQFDGDIPDTIEGLTSLPGVGPKMGYLTLQIAWKKNAGIGVDVHVHRIANRLGWCNTAKGLPEDTRKSLEAWLPKDRWRGINPMLVGFGQILCLPRGPKCSECPVSQYCPSAEIRKVKRKKVKLEDNIKMEEKEIVQTSKFFGDRDPVVKEEQDAGSSLEW